METEERKVDLRMMSYNDWKNLSCLLLELNDALNDARIVIQMTTADD